MSNEQKSPFTPIAGKVPPYLAGRTELIDGVIQERSKGILEFCLPGFREYYEERRTEDL